MFKINKEVKMELKKILRDNIIRLIEASYQTDKEFRDIATSAFDKVVDAIKNKRYQTLTDGSFLLDGSEIGENLSILLVPTSKESSLGANYSGGLGTYKGKPILVLTNVGSDVNTMHNKIKKDIFVHEFIHYLDKNRHKDKSYKPNINSVEEYYNNPSEFNAFYQDGIRFIDDMLRNPAISGKFKEKFSDFQSFYDWINNGTYFDREFLKNMNEETKKKFQKRLYTVWNEHFVINTENK